MLTHPTIDLLHTLGLYGMAKRFKALEATPETRDLELAEWLGLLAATSWRLSRIDMTPAPS